MALEVETEPLLHVCLSCRALFGWGPDQEWSPLCPECRQRDEKTPH